MTIDTSPWSPCSPWSMVSLVKPCYSQKSVPQGRVYHCFGISYENRPNCETCIFTLTSQNLKNLPFPLKVKLMRHFNPKSVALSKLSDLYLQEFISHCVTEAVVSCNQIQHLHKFDITFAKGLTLHSKSDTYKHRRSGAQMSRSISLIGVMPRFVDMI